MSEKNIKVGVIGAGRWGINIIRTLHALGCLSAVADENKNTCADLAREFPGLKIFSDPYALLQDEQLDAVAIATPAKTHVNLVCAAIAANKHIFVEKPLATNSEEITRVKTAAANYSKIIMVGHMLLYQPAITFIKTFIESGKLGRIFSFNQVRRNLGTVRDYENAMYSLGVHDIAVLQYLINKPPKQCTAVGHAIMSETVEDEVVAHIRYDDGVSAHIHVTWMWPYKQRELMILGERGALFFDELRQEVVWYKNTVFPEKKEEGREVVFTGTGEPLKFELAHFIECCLTGKTPLSDLQQGITVCEILERISGQLTHARNSLHQSS